MKKNVFLIVILSIFVLSGFALVEHEPEKIYMTSLEWPPYSGKELPHEGASINIARNAFRAVGYEFETKFYPWKRTIRTAERDLNFIGYLPEYGSHEIEKDFIFSDPIGVSPLGFIQMADKPFKWKTLNDLREKRIGIVYGYTNTVKFDLMVKNGELTVDCSMNDVTNIRKLLRGRIDLAVIDRNVFEYAMNVFPEFAKEKDKIVFNNKLLSLKKLYVCFRNNQEGIKLCKEFNKGLKTLKVQELESDYIDNSLGR